MSEDAPGLLLSCCEWGGIVEGRSSSSSSPVRSGMGFFACPYGPRAGASCICVWGSIGSNLRAHSLVPESVLSGCHVFRALWLGVGGLGPGFWRRGRHASIVVRKMCGVSGSRGQLVSFCKSRGQSGRLKCSAKARRRGRRVNVMSPPGGVRIELLLGELKCTS